MKSIIKIFPLLILLVLAALPVSSIGQALSPGTLSPASKTINYGTSPGQITGTVATGGNGTYTYLWQSSPNNSTWTDIGTATGLNYTPGNLTSTTYYRRSVTSNGVTAYSNTVIINVYPQLLPGTISPGSKNINYDTSPGQITGPSAAGGNGTYTYQWQISINNSTWANITGATGLNYTPGNLTFKTYFRRTVKSNNVTKISNTSTINVYPRLNPSTLSPGDTTIEYNTSPGLLGTTTASGGNGTYTYLWQRSSDKSNWNNIPGATTKDYTPGALSVSTWYRRIVTSNGASANSTIYITVFQPTVPEIDPYATNTNINYIRTWEAKAPEQNPVNLDSRPLRDVNQTTNYFDGLGRPIQTVIRKGSFLPEEIIPGVSVVDFVIPHLYDELGREQIKYLPFASMPMGRIRNIADGSFKHNAFYQQSTFNQKFAGEAHYYSKNKYESSPLSRIEEQFAAGNSWVGSDRGTSVKYFVNTALDEVKIWTVTNVIGNFGSYSVAGSYAAGELYKLITIDEDGNQVIEFKDKEGKLILKKVQFSSEGDPGNGANHNGWYCTYYIYDHLNNLRCIIQPRGVELISTDWLLTDPAILAEQCFRYEYDHHLNIIKKKVPGAGEVWMVYDARDRLVLTQDANLRASNPVKWHYTLYDALNRPIKTGLWENNQTQEYHAAQAINSTTYPAVPEITEELTKTFYDHYDYLPHVNTTINSIDANSFFVGPNNTSPEYAQPWIQSMQTNGLVTLTVTNIPGTNEAIETVYFYDDKSRVIQVQTRNITGGTSILSIQYNFSGQVLKTVNRSVKGGTNPTTLTVCTKNTYDDLGRIVKIEKGLNPSGPLKPIIGMEYDELGQLKTKKLGTNSTGSAHLETLSYDYNIRGWMLGSNRSYLLNQTESGFQDHYFGFELGYDKTSTTPGSGDFVKPQFTGNISGTIWKSTGDQVRRKYDFEYDAVNRFSKATFTQNKHVSGNLDNLWTNGDANFDVHGLDGENNWRIKYDANGNIMDMVQKGITLSNPASIVDAMRYTYMSKSNKLLQVWDDVNNPNTKLGDFHYEGSKLPGDIDYTYDPNGNLISDRNKMISKIVYNHLNLPQSIIRNQDTIRYVYDAEGNKLKKTVIEVNKPIKTTLYLDGMVYENDTLQFISHEEGRIRNAKKFYLNGSSAYELVYDYFLKDHLGNVRMVLTEQKDTAQYMATMETQYRTYEEKLFANIPQTAFATSLVSGGYPADPTTNPNAYVAKVNGSSQKVGPAIILKVMADDSISIGVKSFYRASVNPGPNQSPVNDILTALASGIVGVSGETKGTLAELGNQTSSPLLPILNDFRSWHNPDLPGKPKAYLNWITLNEQLKDDIIGSQSGAKPVIAANGLYPLTTEFKVNKNGYLYIYVSNETENWDVFFDNLTVQHFTGPLLEETHYYPFGLTMAGISSKALKPDYTENKRKFNGIEQTTELDLNQYDAFYRTLDPQIGRFLQIDPKIESAEAWSPYSAMLNNPIRYSDPLGDSAIIPLRNWTQVPVNPFSPLFYQGYANVKAESVRNEYNKEAAKLDKTDKQGRVELKEKARINTPEPFNSIVEAGRPMAGEKAKANDPSFQGNATKTNIEVNETMKVTGALGKTFLISGAVQSSYTIATSNEPLKEAATEAVGWGAAVYVGGEFATMAAPAGPWASFGAGVIGSGIGFFLGKSAGEATIQGLKAFSGAEKEYMEQSRKEKCIACMVR